MKKFAFLAMILSTTAVLATGCSGLGTTTATAPGSPTRAQLDQLLAGTTVISERRHRPGYDRSCNSGHRCVFGPAWTDDYDGPGGHDGCGTRNNVLAAQLTSVTFREGSRCIVESGALADPYTGKTIRFSKRNAAAVQIDHVYPLAAAWDMGAADWPLPQRIRFANDIDFELIAVDGDANQAKGDKTPGQWLPPNRAYHCYYAGKYLTLAGRYRLPITAADRDAVTRIAHTCG